jgi:hypothetical protein
MGEGFCMTKSRRFIDYDKIEEWSPWLDEIICGFAPKNLVRDLAAANPEFIEDACDHLVRLIGPDKLVT